MKGGESGAGGARAALVPVRKGFHKSSAWALCVPASQDIGRLSLLNGFHCSLLSFYLEEQPSALASPASTDACRVLGRAIMPEEINKSICVEIVHLQKFW